MSTAEGIVRVYARELGGSEWWEREPTPHFPDAPCLELGPDVMVSSDNHPTPEERETIKWVCGRCKYQTECLDYAVRVALPWGWWGGLTAKERMPLVRKHQGKA